MHRLITILSLCCSLLIATAGYAQENLIFAIDLIRHGDRTPTKLLAKVPYQWQLGLGQLTDTGMSQEFQLGSALRKKYIDQYHLLPTHYQPGTLYVHSTNYDRTLMSAESFLLGLYPIGSGPSTLAGYQPIPIHTAPQEQDKSLVPADDNIENFSALLHKYVFPTKEWQKKTADLQKNFSRWSDLTGFHVANLDQLNLLSDVLYIYQLHHVPLPPEMTPTDITQIMTAGHWAFVYEFNTRAIGCITGQDLLTTIANDLKKAADEKSALKYILFSAHDSTILSVMSAMQSPLTTPPRYASDLNFALYENTPHHYSVKVTFNGNPVSIAACGGTSCSLPQLMMLTNHHCET